MLTGKNIYKNYGAVPVLRGVDISIGKGEIVSIVGSSGAGKSTLLHILGTLDKADAGYVEMNGVRIDSSQELAIKPAKQWKRFLNFAIDLILIGFLSYAVMILLNEGETSLTENTGAFSYTKVIYTVAIAFLYFFLFEWLSGKTPAKFITQTKVFVLQTASKPTVKDSFIRSLCRLIPFEWFSFFSKNPVGLHDSLSDTIVADASIPYKKKMQNLLPPKQLAMFRNKHIGFIFQFHHLLPEFTALENVCIPGWLAGRKKKEVEQKAAELLQMLGLKDRIENKPNQLSGGEQQRVAVARALINNPDIVFADEPTGNLDSANANELHQIFLDLRNKFSQTFLIVTHNEELAKLGDRILYMKDGKIV